MLVGFLLTHFYRLAIGCSSERTGTGTAAWASAGIVSQTSCGCGGRSVTPPFYRTPVECTRSARERLLSFLVKMRVFGCKPGTADVACSIDQEQNGGRNEPQYEPDQPDDEQGGG